MTDSLQYIRIAEKKMRYPERVQEIINAFYNKHPELVSTDSGRRALTQKIVEQVVYEFPNDGYGWKSSSRTAPPSTDVLAQKNDKVGFIGWDTFDGNLKRANYFPDSMDLSKQHYIEMKGVNHLLTETNQPDTGNTPDVDNSHQTEVVKLLMAIAQNQQAQIDATNRLIEGVRQAINELKNEVKNGIPIKFG